MRRTLSFALLLLSLPPSAQACFEPPDRSGYQSDANMLARQSSYYARGEVLDAGVSSPAFVSAGNVSAVQLVVEIGAVAFAALATLWLMRFSSRRASAHSPSQGRSTEPVLVAAELSALVFDGPQPRRDPPHVGPSGPVAIARLGEDEIDRALAHTVA